MFECGDKRDECRCEEKKHKMTNHSFRRASSDDALSCVSVSVSGSGSMSVSVWLSSRLAILNGGTDNSFLTTLKGGIIKIENKVR